MADLNLFGQQPGGGPHTHPEAEIEDGSLLARLAADEAITGAWDFSAGRLRLVQGPDASKPGTGNSEGQVYLATDTDKLYVWDGAAWKEASFPAHASTHQAGGSYLVAAGRLRTGTDAGKPGSGNTEGDVWWGTDTDKLYVWDGTAWREIGVPTEGRWRSGRLYVGARIVSGATVALGLVTDSLRAVPFHVPAPMSLDALVLEVSTAGSAGSKVRPGIYNVDSSLYPTSLVVDGGDLATDTTGGKTALITATLQPGYYALAYNCGTSPPTLVASKNVVNLLGVLTGVIDRIGIWVVSSTYGPLSASYPGGATLSDAPGFSIFARKA